MGKKDTKKKGKGAEKTAVKTEKKALIKLKRKLAAKGEDDIEKLIKAAQAQSAPIAVIGEEPCAQPTPRSGFSFCANPDKDELILFGGEYYNGSTTVMFNDLYLYNIKKDKWSIVHCQVKPPPRCSHQAVVVSQCGGQMWVLGGEFASPTRSQFYHYSDLWVHHLGGNRASWEQVKAPGAPSARSGHRMVTSRKQLVVLGGFHENIGDFKYFNDVHLFNLETYTWTKIDPVGKVPTCRSGCLMAPLQDGRILVYGGYSREKVKKDVDKATTYTDMYYLQMDDRTTPPKWKWVQSKPSGNPPSARGGLSSALVANSSQAFAFGGVQDHDLDEESMESVFFNDLFALELEAGRWAAVTLHVKSTKKRRRRAKDEISEGLGMASLGDEGPSPQMVQTYDDSIFTVKVGPSSSTSTSVSTATTTADPDADDPEAFTPRPRMNAGVAIRNGILYLYGGIYEEEDKQVTLSDFYAIDVRKLDEWKVLVPFSTSNLEWIESEESSSSGDDSDVDLGGSDDDDDDEEMDTL